MKLYERAQLKLQLGVLRDLAPVADRAYEQGGPRRVHRDLRRLCDSGLLPVGVEQELRDMMRAAQAEGVILDPRNDWKWSA